MHQHLVDLSWNSLLAEFGEAVEVLPRKGAAFQVEAIFRSESLEVGPHFSRSRLGTTQPHIKYRPEGRQIKVGDKVRVRGELYQAEEMIPDGLGGFVFELQKIVEK